MHDPQDEDILDHLKVEFDPNNDDGSTDGSDDSGFGIRADGIDIGELLKGAGEIDVAAPKPKPIPKPESLPAPPPKASEGKSKPASKASVVPALMAKPPVKETDHKHGPLAKAKSVLAKPIPPVPVVIVDHLLPPPPAPKRCGDWWLIRTGRTAKCAGCPLEIPKYGFRMIYCPEAKAEYKAKAPSYVFMSNQINRFYYHVKAECLPAPSIERNVAEVRNRDSLAVEIKELPRSHHETAEQYVASTKSAVQNALMQARLAGHNVDVKSYMEKKNTIG